MLVFFQFLILAGLFRVALKHAQGKVIVNREKGKRIFILGAIYAGVMITRYTLHMARFPAERWTGGSIPIFFHLVLAGFLLVVGTYHLKQGAVTRARRPWNTWLWRGAYVLLALGITAWLAYQLYPVVVAKKLGFPPATYSVSIRKHVRMELPGVEPLSGDIYRSERLERAPTILVRIPLDDNFKGRLFSNGMGRLLAERGYNVIIQGVRGRYHSPGRHIPFEGERKDGIATLKWLQSRAWHDGRTGMWGGSYFGYTQWVLHDQDSLGLSALMTQVSSSRNFEVFYPGGAFAYESALYWGMRSRGEADAPPDSAEMSRAFAKPPVLEADVRAVGDSVPYFRDWVRHTVEDEYWRRVDGVDRARHLKVPALMMAGWFDAYLGSQVRDFEAVNLHADPSVARKTRLVIGPWGHAETLPMPDGYLDRHYRLSSIAPMLDWYDQHLKGLPARNQPKVRLFIMGINAWRDEEAFPLERTKYTAYFLTGRESSHSSKRIHNGGDGGGLALFPGDSAQVAQYRHDPANPLPSLGGAILDRNAGTRRQNGNEARADMRVFTTEALETDLEATGKVKLVLYVSTQVPNTDFIAKLVDVFPDGDAYNIAEGIVRRGFPGKDSVVKLEVELSPIGNVFRKGHRIGLEVMSSNYPRYSINYNTGGDNQTATEGRIAEQSIHMGREHPSHLVLPVIPGSGRSSSSSGL